MIAGNNVLLRKPQERDIEDRLRCGRNPEIVRMFGGDTSTIKPFSRDEAEAWNARMLSNEFEWVIENDDKCIGNVRLTLDKANRRARFAIGIFDISSIGKGLGTEVTQLVLRFAFETLHLHRVDLRTLEYNRRAIACFKKCGFIQEGQEREGALIEGKFETDVIMGILDHEYRPQKRFTE